MSTAEIPNGRPADALSTQERASWFYGRIQKAVEKLNRRGNYFEDEVHLPTLRGALVVGANSDIPGVSFDSSAKLYAMTEPGAVTIGIHRLRDGRGREQKTGLTMVRGNQLDQVVTEPHSGFLVRIDNGGNAELAALDGTVQTALPESTELDAVDFASGTILPLEKRSGTYIDLL